MKRYSWLVLLVAVAWLAFVLWLLGNSPTTPRPEVGATWPIPNHGSTAYLTLVQYVFVIAPPTLGALIAIYSAMTRKR